MRSRVAGRERRPSAHPAHRKRTRAPEHWAIVRGILRRYVPGSAVWAFGSRAAGTARCCSDLDLASITDEPISIDALATRKEAFADSDLPWTVDVVDWAGISDRFRRIMERQRVVLQDGHGGKNRRRAD